MTLGAAAAAVVIGLFGWTLLKLERESEDLRETDLKFEIATADLLANIGFVGMIHDFKNCVLRPDEPEYCTQAEAHSTRAIELIGEIDALAAGIGLQVRLDGLRQSVAEYGRRVGLVRAAHADGLDVRAIDEAVRYDDSVAAEEIEITIRLAREVLDARLARVRDLYLLQSVVGMLAILVVAGWFAALVLRENRLSLSREERLAAVFGAMTGGVLAIDRTGNVAMINPRGAALLGREGARTPFPWPEHIVLRAPGDARPLMPGQDPFRRVAAGETFEGEVYLMQIDDHAEDSPYIRFSGAALTGGEDLAAVLVMEDVIGQEKHRQQIERNSRLDALGQLSGGIAHDFNNMLATILYAVNLALKEEQTERSQRLLRQAATSVDRGRSLTSRLLSFAKRQPGNARSRPVADVFHDFEALARPAIEASIEMVFVPPDPDILVHCDQSQLENAMLNLVLNSRDAILESGQGSQIRVSARGVTSTSSELRRRQRTAAAAGRPVGLEDYRYVEISVIDDGPGMSEMVRRRATDPFFTTKSQGEGTGLGLAMAYAFARQANGEMQLYSDEGHGTTVRLILPRGTHDNRREGPVEPAVLAQGQGETVLLVEDEPDLLAMMSELLADLGYQVETSPSGADALERIQAGLSFDVLASDMVMPGAIDGLTLARRLQRLRPGTPVVLMSGYAERMAAETEGIEFQVLQKPCMPGELADALRAALKRG